MTKLHFFIQTVYQSCNVEIIVLPLQVTATDADTGDSGRVHYSCVLGCEEFAVAGVGGQVVLITRLDADADADEGGGAGVPMAAVRTVVVQATDAGMVPLSSTVSVLVTGECSSLAVHLYFLMFTVNGVIQQVVTARRKELLIYIWLFTTIQYRSDACCL